MANSARTARGTSTTNSPRSLGDDRHTSSGAQVRNASVFRTCLKPAVVSGLPATSIRCAPCGPFCRTRIAVRTSAPWSRNRSVGHSSSEWMRHSLRMSRRSSSWPLAVRKESNVISPIRQPGFCAADDRVDEQGVEVEGRAPAECQGEAFLVLSQVAVLVAVVRRVRNDDVGIRQPVPARQPRAGSPRRSNSKNPPGCMSMTSNPHRRAPQSRNGASSSPLPAQGSNTSFGAGLRDNSFLLKNSATGAGVE